MKLAIIGAGGVRTPLIVKECYKKADSINLTELALMDIDGDHLQQIEKVTQSILEDDPNKLKRTITTDAAKALEGADYVITTFRAGGIESRVADEHLPLSQGVLGQETTGAGGFAMGLRSIPVLLGYIEMMRHYCPNAWLINFANPSGMMAEAAIKAGNWSKAVGICDAPTEVQRVVSKFLRVPENEVYLEYFGLNHLGWTRAIRVHGQDVLPGLIENLDNLPIKDLLPFSVALLKSLRMIPNEYLYYFYSSRSAVQNILKSDHTRGEEILAANEKLFADLKQNLNSPEALKARYTEYLETRRLHYMENETGKAAIDATEPITLDLQGGYADVALRLIRSLEKGEKQVHIINTLNKGAIKGLPEDCVVEVPCLVGKDLVQPNTIGEIPLDCLGLLAQVKAYEQLTIQAAVEGSEAKAIQALITHPLVADERIATTLVKGFKEKFGPDFLSGVN
jgi:Alpha-galactosidases/6-phospho-beta-glucosidases, family 4 of glycosyl hydrolases